ncbi:deazaflavin-dependent oxidoreductase (nitroreductase family) [Murinocardiopsis flavida]|uniref:Deazaflavin-dependent oxidoreductase (Nitroreductase family) n=1 Tax=Murinocardiopsis flavida TaxID=645275 RepID=A0A2P8D2C8_9ACTN|nr:nitroreductase/quinone reductase family protein [Murinocardiopsis flavida]PSK91375.1 deazaflavin-dependent oxidoreductase (nitroreductase family) [Murinocardiopsis flavida]
MSVSKPPTLPPRWFIRGVWTGHRLLYRTTRRGLSRPRKGDRMGMLRLRATGRRTGRERAVILGYHLDGDSFVTLAMNGWAEPDPAWWLNVRAHPAAEVDTVDGTFAVIGREAAGAERDRLRARFDDYRGWGDIDAFSTRRQHTAVVVFDRA